MRRIDREITDYNKMLTIMKQCDCCRIGFYDEDEVYIVPLNFGFLEENKQLILYFHSASVGRKIDLIAKRPKVGFEMDSKHELTTADIACEYSFLYQSIIGNGVVSIVDEYEEKIRGLNCIMHHLTNQKQWDYAPTMVNRVSVFKLVVSNWTCKEH